jgi:uncharacterized damage-inducible protein DinB
MNREIILIVEQIKEAYEGEPWFGKSALQLFSEVNEQIVLERPSGQHSIVELIWHMITWKEFVISRLREDQEKDLHYFESMDWRELDHTDESLWKKGLERLHQVHSELVEVIQQQKDDLLPLRVPERNYDYRKLLNGILQHDIYHLGQMAYINKLLKNEIE